MWLGGIDVCLASAMKTRMLLPSGDVLLGGINPVLYVSDGLGCCVVVVNDLPHQSQALYYVLQRMLRVLPPPVFQVPPTELRGWTWVSASIITRSGLRAATASVLMLYEPPTVGRSSTSVGYLEAVSLPAATPPARYSVSVAVGCVVTIQVG